MKPEKFIAPIKSRKGRFSAALHGLKPGQALRIKTAAEWRNCSAYMYRVGRELGVKFASQQDGDDVLVYIPKISK